MDLPQPVVAAAGSAGGAGLQLPCQIFRRSPAIRRHAVGGMEGAHHAGTLPEQLRQDAHAAGAVPDVKHSVAAVHEPPCVGGQQQQPLSKIVHQNIQHCICAPFHLPDGLHGGVDEDGFSAGKPHCRKVLPQGLFCICHGFSPFYSNFRPAILDTARVRCSFHHLLRRQGRRRGSSRPAPPWEKEPAGSLRSSKYFRVAYLPMETSAGQQGCRGVQKGRFWQKNGGRRQKRRALRGSFFMKARKVSRTKSFLAEMCSLIVHLHLNRCPLSLVLPHPE